ncbi:MAG: hypothetical protein AAFR87_32385 [Bacteroidota bacterium]
MLSPDEGSVQDLPEGNFRVINRMNSGKPTFAKANKAILSEVPGTPGKRAETTGELFLTSVLNYQLERPISNLIG